MMRIKYLLVLVSFCCLLIPCSAKELPLDKRFIQAIDFVNQLPNANVGKSIVITKENDGYILYDTLNKIVVDQFSDKDFYTLHQMIRSSLYYLLEIEPTPTKKLVQTDFSTIKLTKKYLIDTARKADKTLLEEDSSAESLATSLVLLAFLTPDRLEIQDLLKARAWAAIAYYEVIKNVQNDSLLTLLAGTLNYPVLTKYYAARLQDTVPSIYAYYYNKPIIGNDTFSLLLRLRRSILNHNINDYYHIMQEMAFKEVSFDFLTNQLENFELFSVQEKIIPIMPLVIVNERFSNESSLSYLTDDTSSMFSLSIDQIDIGVKKLRDHISYSTDYLLFEFSTGLDDLLEIGTTWLDSVWIRDYWLSCINNSYYGLAFYLVNIKPNDYLIDNFLAILEKNQTPFSKVLYLWLSSISDSVINPNKLLSLIIELDDLHHAPVLLLEEIYRYQYQINPNRNDYFYQVNQMLLSRLDSRYLYRTLALKLESDASNYNFHIDLSSLFLNKYVIEALTSGFNNELLIEYINDDSSSPIQKAQLLSIAFKNGVNKEDYLERLKNIYEQNQDSVIVLKSYVDALNSDLDDPYITLDVLRDWLKVTRDLSYNNYLDVIALFSEAKMKLGDYQTAWFILKPTLIWQNAKTLDIAIKVLIYQDRKEEALELMAKYKAYYPYSLNSLYYQFLSLLIQQKHESMINLIESWYSSLSQKDFNRYILIAFDRVQLTDSEKASLIRYIHGSQLVETQKEALLAKLNNTDIVSD